MTNPSFENQNIKFQTLIKKIVASGQQVNTIVNDKNYQLKNINISLIEKNFKTIKRSVKYAMEFLEIYLLKDRKTEGSGYLDTAQFLEDDQEVLEKKTNSDSDSSDYDSFNSNFANSLSSSFISISEPGRLYIENQELQAKVEMLVQEVYGMETDVIKLKKKLKRLSVFERDISLFQDDFVVEEKGEKIRNVVLISNKIQTEDPSKSRRTPLYRQNYGMGGGCHRAFMFFKC